MRYDTPLYETLQQYIRKKKIPLHMPGHKQGRMMPRQYKEDIFQMDLTEVPGLDHLHNPIGCIKEAQKLAAIAFGAEHSFFLINGATCGIQAMIASVCNPGDELIVDRNCHGSVISALILTGAIPRYIYPEWNTELGIVGGINPHRMEEVILKYPKAKGVILTSPTYHGICSDLETIAQIVHRHDKVLLVDEAHGAHFCFHEKLPQSAMAAGADLCVHGAHKTLPALTQSALLHVKSNRIEEHRLINCLKLFQSSSPSYVLMAYLDVARNLMQKEGRAHIDSVLSMAEDIRKQINEIGSVCCVGKETIGRYSIHDIDLTRLTVHFGKTTWTGYEAADILSQRYDIQVEMADIYNIVCILSAADSGWDSNVLPRAIQGLNIRAVERENAINYLRQGQYAVSPREAFFSESEIVPLKKAQDRICADIVTCFPPGIPVLCPGEVITRDILEYVVTVRAYGGTVTGISNDSHVRVIGEK